MAIPQNHPSDCRPAKATGLSPPGVRTGVTFCRPHMHTAFLIDGFNFYHSIKGLRRQLRWFDYVGYCRHFMRANDTLKSITYFSALATWLPDKVERHRVFVEACAAKGIHVVLGKFKEKPVHCPHCKKNFPRHEEKATDVNIALHAYRLASHGTGQIIFVSGDTDLIPAVRMIKQDFPSVVVGAVFPYRRDAREFARAVHFHHKTSQEVLNRHVLPTTVAKPNGKIITCPPSWQ